MSRNDGTLTRQDLEELQARIDGLEERVKKLEGRVVSVWRVVNELATKFDIGG